VTVITILADKTLLLMKPEQFTNTCRKDKMWQKSPVNPLNAELNPICHLLALLGVHHFLHVSRIRVNTLSFDFWENFPFHFLQLMQSHWYKAGFLQMMLSVDGRKRFFIVMHFGNATQIFSRWCSLLTPGTDVSFLHHHGKNWLCHISYLFEAGAKRTSNEAVAFRHHYVNVIDRNVLPILLSWDGCCSQEMIWWSTVSKLEPSRFFLLWATWSVIQMCASCMTF
jgi:hypothetical protein